MANSLWEILWVDYYMLWICTYVACYSLVNRMLSHSPSHEIHRYTGLVMDTVHAAITWLTFDYSFSNDFNNPITRNLLERFVGLHLSYHCLFCPLSYYNKRPKGWDLVGFLIYSLAVFMSILSFYSNYYYTPILHNFDSNQTLEWTYFVLQQGLIYAKMLSMPLWWVLYCDSNLFVFLALHCYNAGTWGALFPVYEIPKFSGHIVELTKRFILQDWVYFLFMNTLITNYLMCMYFICPRIAMCFSKTVEYIFGSKKSAKEKGN